MIGGHGYSALAVGTGARMRHPLDELLIALSHGLDGWMLGSATDAIEIAAFVDSTGNRAIPKSPEAIDRLLRDMQDLALVKRRSMPPNVRRRSEPYPSVALTDDGWARARDLEAADPSSSEG
jgi:hypothetical protein